MPDASTLRRAVSLIGASRWYEAGRLLEETDEPELAVAARMCLEMTTPTEDERRRVMDLLDLYAASRQPPTNMPPE